MQPWRHAKLSAKRRGTNWRDELPVHEFIDSAKATCPDLRHRILLHNSDLGPALARLAFPDIKNVEAIIRAHVEEDVRTCPRLAGWLPKTPVCKFRWRTPNDAALVKQITEFHGVEDAFHAQRVLDLLCLAETCLPGRQALARVLLMNSFGPLLARQIFGPAYAVGTRIIDPSWIAEGIIIANFGRIWSLSDVLQGFPMSLPDKTIKANPKYDLGQNL